MVISTRSRILYQHPHVPRLSYRGLETIAGVRGQDLVRAACGRVCGGLAATVAIGLSSYGGHRVTRGDGEMATWWWHLPDPSPYTPGQPKKALEDFFEEQREPGEARRMDYGSLSSWIRRRKRPRKFLGDFLEVPRNPKATLSKIHNKDL